MKAERGIASLLADSDWSIRKGTKDGGYYDNWRN